ncbi:hypothetical protein ACIGCK_14585 [Microbacterium sp. NPDC078428]|uniref:hypothetical protein n=1 Tax=Microbacterium sp. NPDC078428 TaxID=3364190 RepID=UPI0037C8CB74
MTDLARKLQIKPGTRLWVWPEDAPPAEPLIAETDVQRSDAATAEVALIFGSVRQDIDTVLTDHRTALAGARAVWIIYAKGNKTDMNRDTLWVQLAGFGWRAVAQVSYDATLSALRVRPLRDGEVGPI